MAVLMVDLLVGVLAVWMVDLSVVETVDLLVGVLVVLMAVM